MTKIYEALELADRERNKVAATAADSVAPPAEVEVRQVMREVIKEAARDSVPEVGPIDWKPAVPELRSTAAVRTEAAGASSAADVTAAATAFKNDGLEEAVSEPEAPRVVRHHGAWSAGVSGPADPGEPEEKEAAEELAAEDKETPIQPLVLAGETLPAPRDLTRILVPHMEETLILLYQNISTLLPDMKSRIIQFIGSTDGEGTSTLAREFAKVVAFRFGKAVLLMDADRKNPCQLPYFGVPLAGGWGDAARGTAELKDTVGRVLETSLWVTQASVNGDCRPLFTEDVGLEGLFEDMKSEYDMVVVDSPSATGSPDGLLLSRRADGVVLVVEAERVRWQVVDKIKNKIAKQGGNLLGVVLNKRRFPIPKFIYSRI